MIYNTKQTTQNKVDMHYNKIINFLQLILNLYFFSLRLRKNWKIKKKKQTNTIIKVTNTFTLKLLNMTNPQNMWKKWEKQTKIKTWKIIGNW